MAQRTVDIQWTDVGVRVLTIEKALHSYQCLDFCQYHDQVRYCGFFVLGCPSWRDQGIKEQSFTLFLDNWNDH